MRIKSLTGCTGWTEFLLPYIEKRLKETKDEVMLGDPLDPRIQERVIGRHKELHEMLKHIEQHANLASSIIAKGEVKVHTPGRD